MYDVIIVGARCAGSSTAMLLARRGYKVLVVDRTRFPSDTLSTHFLWPRGASYLNKWGLLESVLEKTPPGTLLTLSVEGVGITGTIPLEALRGRFRRVHGDDGAYAVQTWCSPRRFVLDALLAENAQAAGAELRTGFVVEGLLREGDRVVGIRGRTEDGTPVTERARVVVGADGRNSVVARALQLPKYDERPQCTFAYYSYYSGFSLESAQYFKTGRLGLAIVPTCFGLNMTLVWGPRQWFDSFLAAPEQNFLAAVQYVAPHLAELLRTRGKREEKFHGTADQAGYCRQSAGLGWALAGDAACFKDQSTAMGMTHAFRDAELLGTALHEGLSGRVELDAALEEYAWRRGEDTAEYLEFAGSKAEMQPTRLDELELFLSLQGNQSQSDRLLAAYGDTLRLSDFFSSSNLVRVRKESKVAWEDSAILQDYERGWVAAFSNPFNPSRAPEAEQAALSRTSYDFVRPSGRNLLERTSAYFEWTELRRQTRTWPFGRVLHTEASSRAIIGPDAGAGVEGVNFASQDYLSLNQHPAIHEAVTRALRDYGPHSAGSPQLIGNTGLSIDLEQALGEWLGLEHVTLFPTGWGAGFGSITGLVRPDDHVVLDKLAHACLQQGAHAATRNVERHVHCHIDSLRNRLRTVRARDARNGILVVTEGLFSMDSDWPDLARIQALCREYEATLLVDVAHDLGSMGPDGTGQLGLQKMLGQVDLVMGSFSKSFASNGGFLASRSPAVKQYLKMFGGPHTFSNALSPLQAAGVREAIRIIRSPEGEVLRERLAGAVGLLRDELTQRGFTCMGQPSPIVPVRIGDEQVLRLMCRSLEARGIHVNAVEFPAVAVGSARFRFQVMASHNQEHVRTAALGTAEAQAEAREHLGAPQAPGKRRSSASG